MELKVVLFLLIFGKSALSANILYVSPVASPSHHIWNKVLSGGLLKNGHNITMLTHETNTKLPENFYIIQIEGFYELINKLFGKETWKDTTIIQNIIATYGFHQLTCEFDYNSTALQILLSYPKDFTFDLIIFDIVRGNRCYYPLIERFGSPPALVASPFPLPPSLHFLFGGHVYSSYHPFYSTDFFYKMSLYERIWNFVFIYFERVYKKLVADPREDALIKERFPDLKASPGELERSIGLLLCNMDPVLDYPVALPPNIVPVGGLHATPSKPLPKDLQTIMDEAKEGVILFSLGTNVKSSELGEDAKKALLEAFAKLSQTILWKFETDELENVPKNVIIRKWLPQNDILGHPNMRLFVNHGGALSLQEAMYHGVPVVGIPFFADQLSNVRRLEEREMAKRLDKSKLTVGNVYDTLNAVLTSPQFKKNMGDLSSRYRSQPQAALERGVFWIEYLLRHKTVEHLVSPARDMPFCLLSNIDVLTVFVLGAVLICYFLLKVLHLIKTVISKPRDSIKQKTQ